MLVTKGLNYTGFALIAAFVLLGLGVNLAPILGAAGILGLAVGIASQASLSNVISGLFLVSEKPFEVGDVVTIGDTTGVVDSIDLLSAKIRTFNNLYVRVPNEKIASSQLTNVTRYPIRRMDFTITVAYSSDLVKVKEILTDIAKDNVLCLEEPQPIVLYLDFTKRGCSILFGVWFQKPDFIAVKNEVFTAIKTRFDEADIQLAIPPRTLSGDPESEPVSIRLVAPESTSTSDV
jgi:small-conductance mechanosensitive channel